MTLITRILTNFFSVGVTLSHPDTFFLNQNKHLHLDAVFAIQIVILIVGICMDYLIGVAKNMFCPYASLTLERK